MYGWHTVAAAVKTKQRLPWYDSPTFSFMHKRNLAHF